MNKPKVIAGACLALSGAFAFAQGAATGGSYSELAASYQQALGRLRSLAVFEATQGEAAPGLADLEPPYDLGELSAIMERDSPSALMAAAAVRAAQGDLSGARAAWIPTLSGSINGAYLGNPQEAISLPAGSFGVLPGPMPLPSTDVEVFPAVDPTQYSLKLVGEQPIFTWGKISAGIRAAEAGLSAARIAQAKIRHENLLRLQGSYEALCYLAEAESALSAQKAVGARILAIAEQNFAKGFITSSDLLGARIKLKEIDIGIAVIAEKRQRLVSEIAMMTGIADLSADRLHLRAPIAGLPGLEERLAGDEIARRNYGLALAAGMVEIKSRLVELARAQARDLPDIGLRFELSYSGSKLPFVQDGWKDADDYQFIIGIGASGKLLGNPVRVGALARATAELDQAIAQRDDAERQLRSFVREGYLALNLSRIRVEYALLKQESWVASMGQMETALRLGAGSESEYLAQLVEALGGIAEAFGTLAEYRASVLSLAAALGD